MSASKPFCPPGTLAATSFTASVSASRRAFRSSKSSWLISSSIGLRKTDGSRPGEAVEIRARSFTRVWPVALLAALALTGCEADEVAARATLTELGFHGIAIERAPAFGIEPEVGL